MACRDEGQGRDNDARVIAAQKERLDVVTRLLCEVLTLFDAHEQDLLTPECRAWWKQHQDADRARANAAALLKAQEAKNKKAQLADFERHAARLRKELGITRGETE